MDEEVGQNYYSRRGKVIYTVGHDSIRLKRWISYYGRSYENILYFDSIASVSSRLIEFSY